MGLKLVESANIIYTKQGNSLNIDNIDVGAEFGGTGQDSNLLPWYHTNCPR